MSEAVRHLKELKPTKEYLVAIDSDGCTFDSMGIEQREKFLPIMISYFGLQPVTQGARECREFADLLSRSRGANRHETMVCVLTELLPSHPTVKRHGFKVPSFKYYCDWVNDPDSVLSNEGLTKAIDVADNREAKEELKHCLEWSMCYSEIAAEISSNSKPFAYVLLCLEKISQKADVIVCSASSSKVIEQAWTKHDIVKYVKFIAGQEMGTKSEHLAIVSDAKYAKDKILMIGDSPGDMNAASRNDVSFFPIKPNNEKESWKRFHEEVFDMFISCQYTGRYRDMTISEFNSCLFRNPKWQ